MDVRHRSSLRRIAGLVVALHGLIHLIGFVVPWRLARIEGFGSTTSAAWGSIEVGETGARLVGLVWLVLAVAFVVAGAGLWLARSWAIPLTVGAALVSLPICVLGAPDGVMGIAIDVLIVATAVISQVGAPKSAGAWSR